ncbi:fimbrial biogenesis outer membrane usher protein [Escherichia coli]|nr:fimbrial biogenesis outer membrane usher protein [Escherichia coli]
MRLKPLVLFVFIFSHPTFSATGDAAMRFNPDFLTFSNEGKPLNVDLSYFSHSDGLLPGLYSVNTIVNGKKNGVYEIEFVPTTKEKVTPLLRRSMLSKWGVEVPDEKNVGDEILGKDLESILPGTQINFDNQNQTLSINIPQRWLSQVNWLRTAPQLWNDGVPSLLMNYRYSGSLQEFSGVTNTQNMLSINSSLNIAGWRLRHDGFFGGASSSHEKGWHALNTSATHDYSFWQGGQFTIGQTSTDGAIFESFPFEGMQLISDDGMIVPWLSSFSPIIRGIAYSQALVIVRQNNQIIWQGNIPAGPFELKDVNPLFSGDMDIEVHEADGTVRRFSQASASIPVLQREGRLRYSASIGRYRQDRDWSNNNVEKPAFVQTTAAWGAKSDITLYGGLMLADNYRAYMFGAGKYHEQFGAFSLDLTQSNSELTTSDEHGQAWRTSWVRSFDRTGTQVSLSGYWYNSPGYFSFNDLQQSQHTNDYLDIKYSHQSRISTQIIQNTDNFGQFSLNTDWDHYFRNEGEGWQSQLNWSFTFEEVSSSLSLVYTKQPQYNAADKSLYLSFTVPFSAFSNYDNASLGSRLLTNNGKSLIQSGVNGSMLDQRLSYSIMEGQGNHGVGNSGSINARYRGTYGEIQSGYSYQKYNKQWMYSARGGVTIHPGGLTLSQEVSPYGANALIDTNGAKGIKVNSGTGVYTDWQGYTVISNLMPYQENSISLDVNSASDKIEIINSDLTVIPSRGALVPARFNVVKGNKALITLIRTDGTPVPFGSIVSVISDKSGFRNNGIVADNGQVWISGLPEYGELYARWGDSDNAQCKASVHIVNDTSEIPRISLSCR